MICRAPLLFFSLKAAFVVVAAPAYAGCDDVLYSITTNVSAFDAKRTELQIAIADLEVITDEDEKLDQEELIYTLRETVILLGSKIEEHSAMVNDACIPDG